MELRRNWEVAGLKGRHVVLQSSQGGSTGLVHLWRTRAFASEDQAVLLAGAVYFFEKVSQWYGSAVGLTHHACALPSVTANVPEGGPSTAVGRREPAVGRGSRGSSVMSSSVTAGTEGGLSDP